MESLARQVAEYQLYHSQKANKIAHYIGFLIALSWISISVAIRCHISFAWIAVIAPLVYYYFLNVKLAVVMTQLLLLFLHLRPSALFSF